MNKINDLKPHLSTSKETSIKPAKLKESKRVLMSRFNKIIAKANKIREENQDAFRIQGV